HEAVVLALDGLHDLAIVSLPEHLEQLVTLCNEPCHAGIVGPDFTDQVREPGPPGDDLAPALLTLTLREVVGMEACSASERSPGSHRSRCGRCTTTTTSGCYPRRMWIRTPGIAATRPSSSPPSTASWPYATSAVRPPRSAASSTTRCRSTSYAAC